MDIEEEFTSSNDHTQIVKRKRTKRRQRTGLIVTSSSSSGASGDRTGAGYFSTTSPTTSSNFSANSEEDEDMANCLMLLSQSTSPTKYEDEKKVEKVTNRKFTAGVGAAVATTGKGGIYVYECKTCNRTFPSFQALGGHRASHKKPKVAVPEQAGVEEKKSAVVQSDCKEETVSHQLEKISDCNQPIYLQRDDKAIIESSNNNKVKVHECSICGSEFSSGQALGGHMRRHRTPPAVVPEKPRKFLSLDLNLPAPEEDCRDSEFVFTPNQQQHNVVFSAAPALVDCHY